MSLNSTARDSTPFHFEKCGHVLKTDMVQLYARHSWHNKRDKHGNSYLGKEYEEISRLSSSFSSSVEKPSISPLSPTDLKEIFTVR